MAEKALLVCFSVIDILKLHKGPRKPECLDVLDEEWVSLWTLNSDDGEAEGVARLLGLNYP